MTMQADNMSDEVEASDCCDFRHLVRETDGQQETWLLMSHFDENSSHILLF